MLSTTPSHSQIPKDSQPSISTMPIRDLASERSAIDDQIAWHYAQIAFLKAKRNALAPICTLPNELLSHIFAVYAVESDALFNLEWTRIMYVCRHWHELVLAAHPLWAFINIQWNGERCFSRMMTQLRCSGMAPVTLNIGHYESLYFTHVILDNSARIHALKLQGQAMGIHDLLSKLPEHDFSILSALDLDPSSNRDELPDDFVKVLPDEMFDGRMPKLRELVVKDVDLPCKLLSGLQMLSLTHCNDSATSLPPTFDLLLEMLGSCPQLRTLLLDLVIYGPLPHQQYASVHLPTLNWLTIRNDAHICTALLNHISFPPTTSIHIEPSGVHVGGDIRNMLVPICKHMRAPAASKPPLLQIECTRPVTTAPNFSIFTTILYRDTTPPTVCDREDPSCPLMIDACPIGEAALRQIISKVLKAIPFESITHLYARRRAHFTVAAWKTAMKLLPALQTVYLAANNDAITFIRVLIQLELLDAPRRRAFPHVRSLHIFAHREERDIRLMLVSSLHEYAELRHANGTQLAVVEFENRNFSLSDQEEKLDQLFPLIGKLIWNNTVYDPATRKAEREAWEMERRAFALKFGIEIE